jgi:hypothetical protein
MPDFYGLPRRRLLRIGHIWLAAVLQLELQKLPCRLRAKAEGCLLGNACWARPCGSPFLKRHFVERDFTGRSGDRESCEFFLFAPSDAMR